MSIKINKISFRKSVESFFKFFNRQMYLWIYSFNFITIKTTRAKRTSCITIGAGLNV